MKPQTTISRDDMLCWLDAVRESICEQWQERAKGTTPGQLPDEEKNTALNLALVAAIREKIS